MKTTCLFLTLVLVPAPAFAQSDYGESRPPGPFHQPVSPLPPELAFSYHHASTAAEGWLRGWAQVIHAVGNYWLSRSQSDILAEQSRWLNLTNNQRLVEFHDWKQARRTNRLEAKRAKNESKRAEKYRAAYELSVDELDRVSGAIAWPEALKGDRYAGPRRRLEVLFQSLVGYVGPRKNCASDIERATQRLTRELQRRRRELPQDDYLAAEKFLRGLKYEPLFRSQVN